MKLIELIHRDYCHNGELAFDLIAARLKPLPVRVARSRETIRQTYKSQLGLGESLVEYHLDALEVYMKNMKGMSPNFRTEEWLDLIVNNVHLNAFTMTAHQNNLVGKGDHILQTHAKLMAFVREGIYEGPFDAEASIRMFGQMAIDPKISPDHIRLMIKKAYDL